MTYTGVMTLRDVGKYSFGRGRLIDSWAESILGPQTASPSAAHNSRGIGKIFMCVVERLGTYHWMMQRYSVMDSSNTVRCWISMRCDELTHQTMLSAPLPVATINVSLVRIGGRRIPFSARTC